MIVFAHRGASGYAPENSLGALKKSLEMGATAVEIDVQMTKDGEIIVLHDTYMSRLTSGDGYVEELDSKYITEQKIKNRFDKIYENEKVPTLREYLKNILENPFTNFGENIFLNIEIKTVAFYNSQMEEKLMEILKETYPLENILISSFDHHILKRISQKYPDIKLGLLLGNRLVNIVEYIESSGLNPYSINYGVEIISSDEVKELKSKGYKVFVYTVNSKDIYEQLKKIGVDGIFSDFPDLLIK